jgi:hypothetical protein
MNFNDTPLFKLPKNVYTRWASPENWGGEHGNAAQSHGGRKGSAYFALPAGDQKVLAQVSDSSGILRRFWVTINDRSPQMLRGLRLDIYWDGASRPAVSAPLGDFFAHGLGRMSTFETALFTSPEGRSFVCYIPMPFKSGMKVVVTNESGIDLPMFFYDIDYTLGDEHGADILYFHACWRRENPTHLQKDYTILPRLAGRGRYLGANLGVIADTQLYFHSWWGEGEVKVYMDGDQDLPTLCGTGTEDYIGTGWGQGQYANLYQGCHVADHARFQYCFYRFHVPDPIYFYQDIRVTIQQIGCWDPESMLRFYAADRELPTGPNLELVNLKKALQDQPFGLYERQDDWSSCAYFYLDSPVNSLPELAPFSERVAGL